MMKPDQVTVALRFAREQKAKAEAEMDANKLESANYDDARARRLLWIGYICAYESVLQIEVE